MPESDALTTLIIIPTYNEAGNIEAAVHQVRHTVPLADVLIVDDGSPDGTGIVADRLAASEPHVFVLHRSDKRGLGAAYLAGFAWALKRPYDVIGEFDADGSHPASALPSMSRALASPDRPALVIGSRWVAGGSVVNWPKSRQFLSRAGNAYARVMLRLPVADATAGFRLYSAAALRAIDLDGVASKGYCFQVDLTLRIIDAGGKIVEIPIEFRERERGESKMSRTIVAEAMVNVTLWGIERAFRRLTHRGDGASSSANDSANRGADRSVSSAETTAAESPVTAVRPPSTPSNR